MNARSYETMVLRFTTILEPNQRTSYLTLCLAFLTVYLFSKRVFKKNGNFKYPPGPKGIPILGNLLQISMTPWLDFEQWKDKYGPLVYLNAAGQSMLVLNSHTVASDLLERKSAIYSDRPRLIVAGEIQTRGLFLALARYGVTWQKLRKAGNEALKKSACIQYHPVEAREAVIMTENLLSDSKAWENELFRQASSKMLSILYGLPATLSSDDPLVVKITEFNKRTMHACSPGSHFVEFFPWMLYIPSVIAPWKRKAEETFQLASSLFVGLFQDTEKRMNEGTAQPSMAGSLIQDRAKHQLSELEASFLCGVMFTGGTFTTVATMSWFFLAMLLYPDKQKKCQAELDLVVGRSRMPTLEDRNNLPYMMATVREMLRWKPAIPAGLAHSTTADDWYQGYFIPKGTVCLPNIWSMNRDPKIYGADANEFNPDRFIDEKGSLLSAVPDTKDEGHVSYGFGPRFCIGRHAGNNYLFISIASILWAANIRPVVDQKTGVPVLPDKSKTGEPGLVMRPFPFECVFEARFEEAMAIIAHTKEMSV